MTQATAESIVDAYGWAVELSVMDLPDEAKMKVDSLCDAIRDHLVLLLSEERKEVELLLSKPSKEVYA